MVPVTLAAGVASAARMLGGSMLSAVAAPANFRKSRRVPLTMAHLHAANVAACAAVLVRDVSATLRGLDRRAGLRSIMQVGTSVPTFTTCLPMAASIS